MITIEPDSYVPAFEQLRSQLAEQIATGQLRAGDKLPTVRRLAGDLGLAPNTVAKAYKELESAGLVETHGRNGTIVAGRTGQGALSHSAAARFVAEVSAAGLDLRAAQQLVAEHWG